MRWFIFLASLLPAFCSNVFDDGELFQVAKRQHPIGMPCKGYEFICRTLSTAVCCHGYCHYSCYDLHERPKFDANPAPRPRPPQKIVAPTTPEPTTKEPTTVAAERPAAMPTPKPCVVDCKDGNLKDILSPEAPVGCTLDFQTAGTVTPQPYNETHSVIRESFQICCPAAVVG